MMDLDEIRHILEMMREHDLAEFELEQDNVKLRLRKAAAARPGRPGCRRFHRSPSPRRLRRRRCTPRRPAGTATDVPVLTSADEDIDLAIVKSPIVGTFYRSAEPGAKPFVEVGQIRARKGRCCASSKR